MSWFQLWLALWEVLFIYMGTVLELLIVAIMIFILILSPFIFLGAVVFCGYCTYLLFNKNGF